MAANRPEGHSPNAPAWSVVDFPEVTAYSMIFSKGPDNEDTLVELQTALTEGDDLPDHLERARVVNFRDDGDDAAEAHGDVESVFLGYWVDPGAHERWRDGCDVLGRPGVYCETAIIPAERWETIQGTKRLLPGIRNLTSVDITELHEYWGSARDRIAASADDPFEAAPDSPLPANLCLIRSGQKWDDCLADERDLYFTDIEPKLRAGIDFLARNRDTGCISSRFLREQNIEGEDLPSTSFVGWFEDLASLEAWSHSHSTHLAIFHSFLSTVQILGRPPKLRLWHEVSVLPGSGVELVQPDLSPLAELVS